MSDINNAGSDLIFELEDRPPFHQALVGAITHLLAIFVPMVTPALIVGAALQLSAETTAYLVSMAMIASGIGTWLQVNRYGIVGSGLLSIQSVNFSFVTVMIALGSSMKSDGFHEELIMSSLLGVSFVGAFLVVGSSFILPYLRRVITPTVSGIVVLMIGLSLIKVGIIDFGGGFAAKSSGTFGNYEHLGVGLLVLIVVIGFNCCRSPLLRMGGIAIGLCVGYIASLCLGMVDFSSMRNLPLITIPHPFKYGFSFSFHQFLVVGTIYLLSVLEAVGDITATAMVSRRPIQGEEYQSRLKGGVLADGLVSVIASAVGSLPLTTFAQNDWRRFTLCRANHRGNAGYPRFVSDDWRLLHDHSLGSSGRRNDVDVFHDCHRWDSHNHHQRFKAPRNTYCRHFFRFRTWRLLRSRNF